MSQKELTDAPYPRSHPESGPLRPAIAPVAGFYTRFARREVYS